MFITAGHTHEDREVVPDRRDPESRGRCWVGKRRPRSATRSPAEAHARLLSRYKHNSSGYDWATASCRLWSVYHIGVESARLDLWLPELITADRASRLLAQNWPATRFGGFR